MIGIRDGKSWLVRIVVYRGISRREPGGVASLAQETIRILVVHFVLLFNVRSGFCLRRHLFSISSKASLLVCRVNQPDRRIEIPAKLSLRVVGGNVGQHQV
jgi:hypothetical protein